MIFEIILSPSIRKYIFHHLFNVLKDSHSQHYILSVSN